MNTIEAKIKSGLEGQGIRVHSVYKMPEAEEDRVLLAFNSMDNPRLTTARVEEALSALGVGAFKVPTTFERLSATFLHLEVIMSARTEHEVTSGAE